jgi:hypothetical protein
MAITYFDAKLGQSKMGGLCFGHVEFEMCTKHSTGDIK